MERTWAPDIYMKYRLLVDIDIIDSCLVQLCEKVTFLMKSMPGANLRLRCGLKPKPSQAEIFQLPTDPDRPNLTMRDLLALRSCAEYRL